MEKIAILSDVHGNITALNTVLNDIEQRGISRIFCLGDSVVKCANPDLVVDLLREKCEVILKGNCDELISSPYIPSGKYWSRDKIGDERAAFLNSLPIYTEFYMSGYLIRLFHSSPYSLHHIYNPMYSNKETRYANYELDNPELLFENTEFIGKTSSDPTPDIIGYGHIHTPNIVRYKNKTLFNPGSVGVPMEMASTNLNDLNNKFSTVTSYIILEGNLNSHNLSSISLNIVRLPYDIYKEIEYLEHSTMPNKNLIINNLKTATYNKNEYLDKLK